MGRRTQAVLRRSRSRLGSHRPLKSLCPVYNPASTTTKGGAMSPQKRLIRRALMLAVSAGVVAVAAVGSSGRAGQVMAAAPGPAALGTCTIDWTGAAGDHQWTTTTNWIPVRVPTTTDYACVASTFTQTVIL